MASSQEQMERIKECFNYFDRDCDGKIHVSELGKFMRSLGEGFYCPTLVPLHWSIRLFFQTFTQSFAFIFFVHTSLLRAPFNYICHSIYVSFLLNWSDVSKCNILLISVAPTEKDLLMYIEKCDQAKTGYLDLNQITECMNAAYEI